MMATRVVHKKPPPLTEHFLEGFSGWGKGALGMGAARRMLVLMVPALQRWLQAQGSAIFVELEGFEPHVQSGLFRAGNGHDAVVVVAKSRGDSILSIDGAELFLSGKTGAERLAAKLFEVVARLDPVSGSRVVAHA